MDAAWPPGLLLGADGVLIGSRFWASAEALVHPDFQNSAVSADGDSTIRTTVVDIVRKKDWPKPFTARVMKNRFVEEWHGREAQDDCRHCPSSDNLTAMPRSPYCLRMRVCPIQPLLRRTRPSWPASVCPNDAPIHIQCYIK